MNDTIKIDKNKLILREFCLNWKIFNFLNNNINPIFTLKLKNEENKNCDYEKCNDKTNKDSENNPIINFCYEEYKHYECKIKSIINKKIKDKDEPNKKCIKTHCDKCVLKYIL